VIPNAAYRELFARTDDIQPNSCIAVACRAVEISAMRGAIAASQAQEVDNLKPTELTVRSNSITGMVEIAISDADFKLVLSRQAVLDLIAKLARAQWRREREGVTAAECTTETNRRRSPPQLDHGTVCANAHRPPRPPPPLGTTDAD
jgi:hypothetical protein